METLQGIIGVVVIYNPEISELIRNINQYIGELSCLIIWQNSELKECEKGQILQDVIEADKILFQGTGMNVGIAAALNWAIQYAKSKDYYYCMSMDQDSYWVNFKNYASTIKENDNPFIGIFGPETIDVANEKPVMSIERNSEEKEYVITSGAIYKVSLFDKIGDFNESYFIDALDEEICFRARKYGMKTVQIHGCYLKQKFGAHRKVRFLVKEVFTPNYAPIRYYYIVRNHLWLAKSGLVSPEYKHIMIRNYIISFPIKAILFERDKIKKIRAILRGLCEGILYSP